MVQRADSYFIQSRSHDYALDRVAATFADNVEATNPRHKVGLAPIIELDAQGCGDRSSLPETYSLGTSDDHRKLLHNLCGKKKEPPRKRPGGRARAKHCAPPGGPAAYYKEIEEVSSLGRVISALDQLPEKFGDEWVLIEASAIAG